MNILSNNYLVNKVILIFILVFLSGCHDYGDPWRITVGKDKPKEHVFVDGDEPQEVMICLDKKGGSGYPTTIVGKFDDEKYAGMLVGQCMNFIGKRVSVKFATPSSGKYAEGTFKVIQKQ